MKKRIILLILAVTAVFGACSKKTDGLVLVKGGTFVNTKSNYYGESITIADFYIGKYEVTQKEWMEVMESNPSGFKGDDLPVESVSWYDSIEYCNKRSIKAGLEPYYNIDKDKKDPDNRSELDNVKWMVTINEGANGYRLLTEAEWEYAAGGGRKSKSYTYSGSDSVDEAAWYWINSGNEILTGFWNWPAVENNHNQTKPVGGKKANELGLYDMSGNVREWCWDWYTDLDSTGDNGGSWRVLKGGGWLGDLFCCEPAFRDRWDANNTADDMGLRVCRNAN